MVWYVVRYITSTSVGKIVAEGVSKSDANAQAARLRAKYPLYTFRVERD